MARLVNAFGLHSVSLRLAGGSLKGGEVKGSEPSCLARCDFVVVVVVNDAL